MLNILTTLFNYCLLFELVQFIFIYTLYIWGVYVAELEYVPVEICLIWHATVAYAEVILVTSGVAQCGGR